MMCDSCDNGSVCSHPDCPRKAKPVSHVVTLSDGTVAHLREYDKLGNKCIIAVGYTAPKSARAQLADAVGGASCTFVPERRANLLIQAHRDSLNTTVDHLIALYNKSGNNVTRALVEAAANESA